MGRKMSRQAVGKLKEVVKCPHTLTINYLKSMFTVYCWCTTMCCVNISETTNSPSLLFPAEDSCRKKKSSIVAILLWMSSHPPSSSFTASPLSHLHLHPNPIISPYTYLPPTAFLMMLGITKKINNTNLTSLFFFANDACWFFVSYKQPFSLISYF